MFEILYKLGELEISRCKWIRVEVYIHQQKYVINLDYIKIRVQSRKNAREDFVFEKYLNIIGPRCELINYRIDMYNSIFDDFVLDQEQTEV